MTEQAKDVFKQLLGVESKAAMLIVFFGMLLGGGGIVAWVDSGRDADAAAREQTAVNFELLMSEMRQNNNEMREDIAALERKVDTQAAVIEDQANTIRTLQKYVVQLETAQVSLPMPMWVKDRGGVMLFANEAYEEKYLTPRGFSVDDYIGKKDEDVWPVSVAEEFRRHDLAVLSRGEVWRGFEGVENANGDIEPWRIMKWPIKLDGIVIAIGGIAWQDFEHENL